MQEVLAQCRAQAMHANTQQYLPERKLSTWLEDIMMSCHEDARGSCLEGKSVWSQSKGTMIKGRIVDPVLRTHRSCRPV